MSAPVAYSRDQIRLHWAVVALIAAQYLLHQPITDQMAALRASAPAPFDPAVALHVFAGLAIFGLALWRAFLRVFRGAPTPTKAGPGWARWATRRSHDAIYALLLAIPLTGAIGWFPSWTDAAALHVALQDWLLAVVIAHLALVAYHHLALRTGPLERMRRPEA
ncbi:MAG: cytochrome b [Rubrimonas sp.]